MTQRDLSAVLGFLRGTYAIQDLSAFPIHVISTVSTIVRCEITSYNEVNPRRRRYIAVAEPPDPYEFPDRQQIFERHIPEHPLIAHHQRTHDARALKISDFLTRSQFHRLGLYNEFFRRVGVEHQMAFTLPAPGPLIIGIALSRGQRDFSERERLLLNLLRPHLIQAYHNAEAATRTQQALALVEHAVEGVGRGVVLLTAEGRVLGMTPRARQWLEAYFGAPPRQADRLPETLARWVRHQEAALSRLDEVPPPRESLTLEREGKRLVVRLLSDPAQSLLLLEEQPTTIEPASLERLGITRREAEVLAWVAQGKTNAEIGMILGPSPRTVAKHLERIYQKLGVETRTAAAALALTSAQAA